MNFMLEQVRRCLTQRATPSGEGLRSVDDRPETLRSAAVLILMLEVQDDWHLLYIRRAENDNDYHSGQVAFPGGCFEPSDDDLKATALREAHEEVGIAPNDVEIVGRLGDLISTTKFRIVPFVGVIPWPYSLRLAPSEVARAFTIPLNWLSDPDNRELYEHTLSNTTVTVVRYRQYSGELLWGATARMTVSLVQTLTTDNNLKQARLAMRQRQLTQ